MPGVIDDQVHFREPGMTYKADIRSESAAKICGGVTSYGDVWSVPNTNRPPLRSNAWKRNSPVQQKHPGQLFVLPRPQTTTSA